MKWKKLLDQGSVGVLHRFRSIEKQAGHEETLE